MLKVFKYLDPIEFLNDAFEEKRQANSNFSLRMWANILGLKSHGPLHAMLKGQRQISKPLVPKLIKSLKLPEKEARYFEFLVDLHRSKSNDEREFYLDKLTSMVPKKSRDFKDIEAYKYITEPLHIILAEMTQLKKFKDNISWIKLHLRSNPNLKDIEMIMDRLMNLEILTRKSGKIEKNVQHIYTAKEVMSEAVQLYHKKMGMLAVEEISKQDVSEREFNAISFNISKKNLGAMKEKIRQFADELVQEYESPKNEGDETYHLNIQLFSLTK